MIWVTWRQHRKQLTYTLIALALAAAVIVPTGLAMHHDFASSGLAACIAKNGTAQLVSTNAPDCSRATQAFQRDFSNLQFIGVLFVVFPVFVGIFYGAPLVAQEFEHGTHRFVWTQGVSRARWAVSKFGLISLVGLAIGAIYAYGVTWWAAPLLTQGSGRLNYLSFDISGVAPVAYTVFAVALGIALGVLVRKTLPAMGITLAAFIAVRAVIEWVARKNYLSPVALKVPVTSALQYNSYAGDWIYGNDVVGANGRTLIPSGQLQCQGGNTVSMSVSSATPLDSGANPCADPAYKGAFNVQTYQPGTRFWEFQWIETGVFLGLAALLVGFALLRLRRIS